MIDVQTIKNLELIHNSITKKSTGTLYGLVNYCSTPMGERLLRMNIVQPMADSEHLRHRLDAIEELMAESDRFFSLKQSLKATMKKRVDVDKIIQQMLKPPPARRGSDPKVIEAALSQLIHIRHIFSSMSDVCASLAECESLLLKAVHSLLQTEEIRLVVEIIDACIHSDLLQGTAKSNLSSRNARLYAVRAGRDSILDAARQTYQENTQDALEQCERYAEQYNLPFKINFSTTLGYSLELPAGEVRSRDLPKQFVNVAKTRGGKSVTMTTVDLVSKLERAPSSVSDGSLLHTIRRRSAISA
jgi:DNA mismatch repair protein MSH4